MRESQRVKTVISANENSQWISENYKSWLVRADIPI